MKSRLPRLAALVLLGTSSFLNAQIFHVQGGISTIFGANGASVDVKAPRFDAQIGAGWLDGHFQFGFLGRTKVFGNDILSVGDDTIKVELPTDVFDASHYFIVRGVGLRHDFADKQGGWSVFGGSTSLGFSTPFFLASRSDSGLGAMYYDHKLGSQFRFVSRNLFSDQQTSIQGIEWSLADGVKVSASGGVGSNQPYLATALQLDWQNLALRAAYIEQGENFKRMQVPSPISTEPDKANIAAVYRVTRSLTVRGTHQNVVQPAYQDEKMLRSTVDEAYANLDVAKFDIGGGLIDSRVKDRSSLGVNLYAMRAINRMISVNGNFYQSRPNVGTLSNSFTATVREQVNQKLAITQTLMRSNGQTMAGLGGEYVGNWLNASVGYQTVYVPFRPENAFQQALSFNARVNLPRNLMLTAGSFVDPEGSLRYTVGLGSYMYRFAGMTGPAGSAQTFRFQKYVVEGIVVDPSGNPLEGAAIHIDGKVAYSDSDGRFMMRMDKTNSRPLVVALDEFVIAGNWQVVSAPESVSAQLEDEATPVRIVLKRIPVAQKN